MDNKKTLILSIVGILVLIVAVIGVSFAMFSFSATGTKENVIKTGSVSFDCANAATMTLSNQYPMTDAVGSQLTGNSTMSCDVTATISGSMTLNYEVALSDISEGTTLKDDYIKFNIKKGDSYLLNTTATTGITMASRASSKGSIITEGYLLDSGSFTTSGSVNYTIRAWVSSDYDLPNQTVTTSGTTQSVQTTSETFSFKFKASAAQA